MVIDTGIFIDYLRASDKEKTTLYNLPDNTDVYLSSVTLYELYMGATSAEKWQDVKLLTDDIPVLPFNKQVAEKAGSIYQELRRSNKMIEFRDIFIAATALIHGLPVLSRNKKHFKRIKGLMLVQGE
ncbi:MAG: type II toxin-antitoxin system VapC family toxin [Cyclobacteriaceae bacterium]|nr:type II toxin-antitoxin system VapC family toxin [Cyclobacteriaceae bacterium]